MGNIRKRTEPRQGSALIWAVVVTIVLVIMIAIIGSVVMTSSHNTARLQVETQAYYTARTLNESLADWIHGQEWNDSYSAAVVSAPLSDSQTFVKCLINGSGWPVGVKTADSGHTIVMSFSEADLGGKMGKADATITINSGEADPTKQNTEITIETVGYFGDDTETITTKLFLLNESSVREIRAVPPDPSSAFDVAPYDTRASALNALTQGEHVTIGDTSAASANITKKNGEDLTTINNEITDSSSNREVIWGNATGAYGGVNGTFGDSSLDGKTKTDTRRMQVGKNGMLLVNPIHKGGHGTEDGYTSTNYPTETGGTNTKITTLAIDTSNAQKDILLRIANAKTTSQVAWNGLMTFNFTDNNNAQKTKKGFAYYPISWGKADIFVQSSANLRETNLLLGPFGHKYSSGSSSYLDYWNYGAFMDYHNGTVSGEFRTLFPDTIGTHGDNKGMPYFPVTYDNAHIWCLDGGTTKYFRILQGVNLVDSSLYSNRSTIIGGGLVAKDNTDKTSDNVNSGLDGFMQLGGSTNYEAMYITGTTRFSATLIDTDIILGSTGTSITSIIRKPDDTNFSAQSHPRSGAATLKIDGGTIYVKDKQTLQIQGAVKDNMSVKPDEIVIAQGAAVVATGSAYQNIETDFYVSGTLTLKSGARVKGRIFTESGAKVIFEGGASFTGETHIKNGSAMSIGAGTVITGDVFCAGDLTVLGSFTLNHPAVMTDDPATSGNEALPEFHGIFVYNDAVAGVGKLTLPVAAPLIAGTSGKIHTFGTYPQITGAPADNAFCNAHHATTNTCMHWGKESGAWYKEVTIEGDE